MPTIQDLPNEDTNDHDDKIEQIERALGNVVAIPTDPGAYEIDVIRSEDNDRAFHSRFTIPEFTSLCPVTGQPDFATVVIDYVPKELLIESKSLKLYMFSFRNHGAYHERVANMIGKKLFDAARPYWLQVSAYFFPRGGIPIDVFVRFGSMPMGVTLEGIPPHNIPLFNGR